MPNKRLDFSGSAFGRLTVLSEVAPYISPGGQRHRQWYCLCDCGNKAVIRQSHLRSGHASSCGCLSGDIKRKHGESKTPAYRSWQGMMSRCYKSGDISWQNYGGRGITVCERWHDFENFLSDMGQPNPGESIDRLDNDGCYNPENCRWATMEEQSNNKRSNVFISFQGDELTVSQWAKRIGIPAATLRMRIKKGWSVADALTIPLGATTPRLAQSISRLHKSGEDHFGAKMTFKKAEDMRQYKSSNPDITLIELGKLFGVGKETARKVIRRIAWSS